MRLTSFVGKLIAIPLIAVACGSSADSASHDRPESMADLSQPEQSDLARCQTDEDCILCKTAQDPEEVGCYHPCDCDGPTTLAVCEANSKKLDQLCDEVLVCTVACGSAVKIFCVFGVCIPGARF